MAGEKCSDERVSSSPEDAFRINVSNCIVDTINQTMENRFAKHKLLYLVLAVFDPRRFDQMKAKLPENALDKVSALIPSVDKDKLREEIVSFMNVWPSISRKTIEQDYCTDETEKSESSENIQGIESIDDDLSLLGDEEVKETTGKVSKDDEDFSACTVKRKCNSCIKCAFEVIVDYNMYSLQYTELYKVYKYLLTFPLTQVTCKQVFSKLKLINTRLRATLTDDNLEAFVLMNTERNILINIDSSLVIDKQCESSSEMRRLLIV